MVDLKTIRLRRGESRADLASALVVATDTIKDWECGRRSMSAQALRDVRNHYCLGAEEAAGLMEWAGAQPGGRK